jgi:putative transposase
MSLLASPVYKGKWLIVYEDDASRYIVGYGIFDSPSSKNAVDVLDEQAVTKYGKPRSILSDRGSSFYVIGSEGREKGLTDFDLYLMRNHIKQVLGRVSHPQTNG